MNSLTGHIFELVPEVGTGGGGGGETWASPFILEASETDEANGFVDLPNATIVAASLFVSLNGLLLSIGHDYTIAGNRVTFTSGCLRASDLLSFRYQIP